MSKKFFSLFLAVSFFSGCIHNYTPTRNFSYAPVPVSAGSVPGKQGILVVKQLNEARGERTYPNSMGSIFKTYIPFLPHVSWGYERLDESDAMTQAENGKKTNDSEKFTVLTSKSIAEDLKTGGLFKDVRYIGGESVPSDADFILSGDLNSTVLDTTYTSYCLGMIGVLLWLLPLPMARTTGTVEANLNLADSSGKTIWTAHLLGKSKKTYTMYNSAGKPISSAFSLEVKHFGSNNEGVDGDSFWAYHASALRKAMGEVKPSLAQAVK